MQVCSRLISRIAVWNPAEFINVHVFYLLCAVQVAASATADHSFRGVLTDGIVCDLETSTVRGHRSELDCGAAETQI